MDGRDRLLGLIHQLYAAPGSIEGWQIFLESLRTAVHGSGASLICHDPRSHQGTVAAFAGSDADGMRRYQQHWSAYDPWALSPKLSLIGEGSVAVGDELIEHAAFRRTAFYCDFGRLYDVGRCMVGMIDTSRQPISVVSINRTERQRAFENDDTGLLGGLMPHLQRSFQLHRRLVESEALSSDLAALVDSTMHAVIVVNAAGRITFVNQAASRLIASRDGLMIEAGELRTSRAADTTRLRAMIADAVSTSSGEGLAAGGVLAIGRPSGRRPLAALVSPMTQARTLVDDGRAALVCVTDPEQPAVANEDSLRSLFGLTPAEAALTRQLAYGCSLKEAAARLGVTRETVRSRLKTIFEKTDTHAQAELVRLVLCGTPPIAKPIVAAQRR